MSAPFGPEHFEPSGPAILPAFAGYLGKAALAFQQVPHRRILSLDYETWSECELPKTGASVYARHPTTEVLMLAYGYQGEPVKQWVPVAGEIMPYDLWADLHDPSVTLSAWNAPFEMAITEHTLGIDSD
ncbi:hypothetical protein ACM25O_13390 [Sulfitobacter pontiacus]